MAIMSSLESKIHHARSLVGVPHEKKLVDYKNIEELVKAQVSQHRDKNYLVYYYAKDFKEKSCSEFLKSNLTYKDFYSKVSKTINLLKSSGLKKGDRIATISHNHSDTVIQYFAAWVMGLVVVPINVSEDTERIIYILNHSNVKLAFIRDLYLDKILGILKNLSKLKNIVCTGALNSQVLSLIDNQQRISHAHSSVIDSTKDCDFCHFSKINDLSEEYRVNHVNLDDEALIVFTSGTTGNPKAVVLTQYNLLVDAKNISEWHGMKAEQTMMCVLPIHHVNGTIVTIMSTMFFGGSLVLNDKFRTSTFFKRISEEKVNVVSVVPTLLAFLLEGNKSKNLSEGLDLTSFRHLICGAGPLTVELAHEFEETFNKRIVHGYGLSETTCYSCFLPISLGDTEHQKWMRDYGFPSIGKALPVNEMDIHDEAGKSLAASKKGEIVIKGHNVMLGYYRNGTANEETFKHGWFRSGDEGFYEVDDKGDKYFFITGRLKELIIRGGVNVSPLEIDEVIMAMHGVKAGISVGFENNMYGEEVGAYVQLEEAYFLTEKDVIEHCSRELPFHKCPKVVLFGNDIPVTSTGKYQRNKLKPLFADYKDSQFKK